MQTNIQVFCTHLLQIALIPPLNTQTHLAFLTSARFGNILFGIPYIVRSIYGV